MQKEYRRLFSLNLALLMLLTVMGPLSGPAAKASDDTVYTVDGQSFTGDGSGKGWTYKTDTLTLDNYAGGAIVFPRSLKIQVSGSCSVTALEGAGISTTLVEIKFLPDSSLRVVGGSGSPAVEATVNWLGIRLPGELTAISGGSGVPALRAGTSIQIGGTTVKVNENVSVKAGSDEQSLEEVASYSGQECVQTSCDQVVLRFDPNGGTLNGEMIRLGLVDRVQAYIAPKLFGGADRYYTPFLSPNANFEFQTKELREIDPENNRDLPVVPQILTNRAEYFIWAARECESRGYGEVNLNLGCPSGTVTGKKKGAGLLAYPEEIGSLRCCGNCWMESLMLCRT